MHFPNGINLLDVVIKSNHIYYVSNWEINWCALHIYIFYTFLLGSFRSFAVRRRKIEGKIQKNLSLLFWFQTFVSLNTEFAHYFQFSWPSQWKTWELPCWVRLRICLVQFLILMVISKEVLCLAHTFYTSESFNFCHPIIFTCCSPEFFSCVSSLLLLALSFMAGCKWSFFQFRLTPVATRVHVFALNTIPPLFSFCVGRLMVKGRMVNKGRTLPGTPLWLPHLQFALWVNFLILCPQQSIGN